MSEPTGPVCPQCGTPRAADGTPACPCGRHASEAHRDTRTAQAAAAEDFDPVRIRPFVTVGDNTEPLDGPAAATDPVSAHSDEPAGSTEDPEDSEGAARPSPVDERPPAGTGHDGKRRRRRALLAAGAGAAAVAALAAAGLVGGLFTYEAPARDGAPPDDVRAQLPEAAAQDDASSTPTPSGPASPAQPSGTPTASPETTPTESPATPTGTADPTRTPSHSGATVTAAPAPSQSGEQSPVLRFGDKGPEVTELQLRLRQVGLYGGAIDGDYDRQVESAVRGYQLTRVVLGDEPGVYGRATRGSLESETSEP